MTSTYAQQTAFFEWPLYFEDAMGNKDTIIIGSDPNANSFSATGPFGEDIIDNSVPWDSIFEVRACEWIGYCQKKAIVEGRSTSYAAGYANSWDWPSISIHAIHFPITIRWDSSLVNSAIYPIEFMLWTNTTYWTSNTNPDNNEVDCEWWGPAIFIAPMIRMN